MRQILTCLFLIGSLQLTNQVIGQQASSTAFAYLDKHHKEFGLTLVDILAPVITDQYTSKHNGLHHIYFRQSVNGIEVNQAVGNANISSNGRIVSFHQSFESQAASRINTTVPSITAEQAVQFAGTALSLLDGVISLDPISPKLMYHPLPSGEIRLAWNFPVREPNGQNWWDLWIDAENGAVLHQINWMLSCDVGEACEEDHQHIHPTMPRTATARHGTAAMIPQYNVLPFGVESPNHGVPTLLIDPSDPIASPFGWHDTDGEPGAEFTITRGNNVLSQEDANGNNGAGYSPDGGVNLDFNFPLDFSQPLGAYEDASITNLFVWNNYMHDLWYHYGFDEEAGNFQQTNYTGLGAGGDFVFADARDGSGTNNANFGTPPDGNNPRMQMFLWDPVFSGGFTVNSPATIAGTYNTGSASFGPSPPTAGITEDMVLVQDSTGNNEGCFAFTNAAQVSGKIALIDRGNCPFVTKVRNAQAAGALAVVVANNVGGGTITMGTPAGDNGADITIPSVMVSLANGNTIKGELANTVNATLGAPLLVGGRDGDYDNGVVAHEYGHGISNRLTGGPAAAGCLTGEEQAGEGWSDFFTLMMTTDSSNNAGEARGIGTFALNQNPTGQGIRTFRYSTNMAINPLTYDDIKTQAIPHGVGEVFCVTVWDMYWALVDVYGFDSDLYGGSGGNNLAMQLVMDGMKIQPCNPGFMDMRDAILEADQQNNGGANECLIWEVFARRGMGYSADQGSSASRSDGTEAFDLPPVCQEILYMEKLVDRTDVPAGDTLTYTLNIINNSPNTLTNVLVRDTMPENTAFIPGSDNCGGLEAFGVVLFQLGTMAPGQVTSCSFKAKVLDSAAFTVYSFEDNLDSMQNVYTISTNLGSEPWRLDTLNPRSGTHAFYIPHIEEFNDQLLTLPPTAIDSNTFFFFWHAFDTESSWDGGFLEISNSLMGNWQDLGPFMTKNGYNNVVQSNSPAGARDVFGGNSNGYIQTTVDLTSFAGQTVFIRFRAVVDEFVVEDGWYLDDFAFGTESSILNRACVTSNQGDLFCAEHEIATIITEGMFVEDTTTSIEAIALPLGVQVYPNPTRDHLTISWEQSPKGDVDLRVFSPQGQLLEERSLSRIIAGDKNTLSLKSYPAGVYLIEIHAKEGVNRYKIIKE